MIVEGISGSGKTILKDFLKTHLKGKKVYDYTEDDLLLGWRQVHVPHLSVIRVDFFNIFLDYIQSKLDEDPENDFNAKYDKLVARIKKLPVHILIAKLHPFEIRNRMAHRERTDQWDQFVKEKLILRGYEDLETLSIEQQETFFITAEEQGIPFSPIHVEIDK